MAHRRIEGVLNREPSDECMRNRTIILFTRTANTTIRVSVRAEMPQGYTDPFLENEGLFRLRLLDGSF